MESSDTTRISFIQICSLWRQIYGDDAVKVSTLLKLDRDNEKEAELFHALESVCPKKISSLSIATWIRKNRDRNIGGYKIVEAEYREHNTALWRVVVTEAAEAFNQDNYDKQSNATSASNTLTFFLNDVDFDDDDEDDE